MNSLVIDTCILVHILQGKHTGMACKEAIQQIKPSPRRAISVVTQAELHSFAISNKWSESRLDGMAKLIDAMFVLDVQASNTYLMEAYTMIDGFSKRSLPGPDGNLLVGSAKKMTKNDLWIAATAYSLEAPLITCDGDFDHLQTSILTVIKVPQTNSSMITK